MARVLYLTQVLPYPLNTGARVRQYYVLRQLARTHEVTLVSFVRGDDKPEHVAHLKTFCHAVHTVPMTRSRWRDGRAAIQGLLTQIPIVIARDEIVTMQQTLARLQASESFDVVHADQVSMSRYGLLSQTARHVLDLHNAMYLVTERLAAHETNPLKRLVLRREARALARYEAELCAKYDQVTFVTDEDRKLIEQQLSRWEVHLPDQRFTTIPICIDPSDKPPIKPVAQPQRITALGVMFWPPNAEGVLWFAQEIWPRIHAQQPHLIFTVVGKNPPEYLTQLHGTNGIEVLGFVPEVEAILADTAVFVVPLRAGGGMRVKILDTWSWGLPIVSTSIGAEGIDIRDGENILIADTPTAFSAAVLRAANDLDLNQCLRRNGRRWVEEKYDWKTIYRAWDEVYARLLKP
ncbi:polysaccharide biosynthesis protein PslH [Thermoflexales bacterium]|nr:polysaccharide biosynthesis protein PslH [Thermoflexales bacterium]